MGNCTSTVSSEDRKESKMKQDILENKPKVHIYKQTPPFDNDNQLKLGSTIDLFFSNPENVNLK